MAAKTLSELLRQQADLVRDMRLFTVAQDSESAYAVRTFLVAAAEMLRLAAKTAEEAAASGEAAPVAVQELRH